jgi:RNA polymerase sigma factor (sigma-70 family)
MITTTANATNIDPPLSAGSAVRRNGVGGRPLRLEIARGRVSSHSLFRHGYTSDHPERRHGKGWRRRAGHMNPIQAAPDREERVAAAYAANIKLLRRIARRDAWHIPSDEIDVVIHDTFVAFIRSEANIGRTAIDEQSWLIATLRNVCRYYLRRQRNHDHSLLDELIDPVAVADDAIVRDCLAVALRWVPMRCRDLLRARYCYELSSSEIADWQEVKVGSARNLLSKCLLAARAALRKAMRRRDA